jgi:hypothetical protein
MIRDLPPRGTTTGPQLDVITMCLQVSTSCNVFVAHDEVQESQYPSQPEHKRHIPPVDIITLSVGTSGTITIKTAQPGTSTLDLFTGKLPLCSTTLLLDPVRAPDSTQTVRVHFLPTDQVHYSETTLRLLLDR